jgi:hypothetical protein
MLFVFNLYSKCLTKEGLEGFEDYKIRGQVIGTAKYADDLVLLVEKEPVLRGMLVRLNEFGRCYRMEMNVERTKVLRISRQLSPIPVFLSGKITMLRVPSA